MGCLWQVYKSFAVLFFTLFIILILAGVFLLAGIGVVDVPGLSSFFGFGAEPTPTPTAALARETPQAETAESDSRGPGTPVPGSTATPEVVSEQTAAIQRAEDALRQAEEPGRFTIEVADSDLTALLGELIASLDDPPVSNLVVTFEQDAFAASGTVIAPFRANIQVKGHFVVAEETVRIVFTEAKLGAIAMPGALRDQLTEEANRYIDSNVGATQRLRIDSVEIVPGKIIVTGERLR